MLSPGLSPKAEEPEIQCLSSVRQRLQILPSSTFLFLQALSGLDDTPPVERAFTQSTDSNANLIGRHPHKHIQK